MRCGSVVVVAVAVVVVVGGVCVDVVCVVGFGGVGNGIVNGETCDSDGVGNGIWSGRKKRKGSRKRVKRRCRNEWYGNGMERRSWTKWGTERSVTKMRGTERWRLW